MQHRAHHDRSTDGRSALIFLPMETLDDCPAMKALYAFLWSDFPDVKILLAANHIRAADDDRVAICHGEDAAMLRREIEQAVALFLQARQRPN